MAEPDIGKLENSEFAQQGRRQTRNVITDQLGSAAGTSGKDLIHRQQIIGEVVVDMAVRGVIDC